MCPGFRLRYDFPGSCQSSQNRTRVLFSHWFVPRAPHLSGADDARAWNRQQIIGCSTLHKTLGERIGELPQTGHFNRSAFVKKCPGGIVPSYLEAHGADCSSAQAHILYTIAYTARNRIQIFLVESGRHLRRHQGWWSVVKVRAGLLEFKPTRSSSLPFIARGAVSDNRPLAHTTAGAHPLFSMSHMRTSAPSEIYQLFLRELSTLPARCEKPLAFALRRCALGLINTASQSTRCIHTPFSLISAPRSNTMFTWLGLISLALGASAFSIRDQGPAVRLDNAVGDRSLRLSFGGY